MIIFATSQEAYEELCMLPLCPLPLRYPMVDIDPDALCYVRKEWATLENPFEKQVADNPHSPPSASGKDEDQ